MWQQASNTVWRGIIYQAWENAGNPTEQGWHVSANDLIKTHTHGKESYDTLRLLVDFHPSATWRIGIIELLNIYIDTYAGGTPKEASWSPMMLHFRDIYYEEFEREFHGSEKENMIKNLKDRNDGEGFVEFLYLNGTHHGWNWGTNGRTNAAFIQGEARDYFRNFF